MTESAPEFVYASGYSTGSKSNINGFDVSKLKFTDPGFLNVYESVYSKFVNTASTDVSVNPEDGMQAVVYSKGMDLRKSIDIMPQVVKSYIGSIKTDIFDLFPITYTDKGYHRQSRITFRVAPIPSSARGTVSDHPTYTETSIEGHMIYNQIGYTRDLYTKDTLEGISLYEINARRAVMAIIHSVILNGAASVMMAVPSMDRVEQNWGGASIPSTKEQYLDVKSTTYSILSKRSLGFQKMVNFGNAIVKQRAGEVNVAMMDYRDINYIRHKDIANTDRRLAGNKADAMRSEITASINNTSVSYGGVNFITLPQVSNNSQHGDISQEIFLHPSVIGTHWGHINNYDDVDPKNYRSRMSDVEIVSLHTSAWDTYSAEKYAHYALQFTPLSTDYVSKRSADPGGGVSLRLQDLANNHINQKNGYAHERTGASYADCPEKLDVFLNKTPKEFTVSNMNAGHKPFYNIYAIGELSEKHTPWNVIEYGAKTLAARLMEGFSETDISDYEAGLALMTVMAESDQFPDITNNTETITDTGVVYNKPNKFGGPNIRGLDVAKLGGMGTIEGFLTIDSLVKLDYAGKLFYTTTGGGGGGEINKSASGYQSVITVVKFLKVYRRLVKSLASLIPHHDALNTNLIPFYSKHTDMTQETKQMIVFSSFLIGMKPACYSTANSKQAHYTITESYISKEIDIGRLYYFDKTLSEYMNPGKFLTVDDYIVIAKDVDGFKTYFAAFTNKSEYSQENPFYVIILKFKESFDFASFFSEENKNVILSVLKYNWTNKSHKTDCLLIEYYAALCYFKETYQDQYEEIKKYLTLIKDELPQNEVETRTISEIIIVLRNQGFANKRIGDDNILGSILLGKIATLTKNIAITDVILLREMSFLFEEKRFSRMYSYVPSTAKAIFQLHVTSDIYSNYSPFECNAVASNNANLLWTPVASNDKKLVASESSAHGIGGTLMSYLYLVDPSIPPALTTAIKDTLIADEKAKTAIEKYENETYTAGGKTDLLNKILKKEHGGFVKQGVIFPYAGPAYSTDEIDKMKGKNPPVPEKAPMDARWQKSYTYSALMGLAIRAYLMCPVSLQTYDIFYKRNIAKPTFTHYFRPYEEVTQKMAVLGIKGKWGDTFIDDKKFDQFDMTDEIMRKEETTIGLTHMTMVTNEDAYTVLDSIKGHEYIGGCGTKAINEGISIDNNPKEWTEMKKKLGRPKDMKERSIIVVEMSYDDMISCKSWIDITGRFHKSDFKHIADTVRFPDKDLTPMYGSQFVLTELLDIDCTQSIVENMNYVSPRQLANSKAQNRICGAGNSRHFSMRHQNNYIERQPRHKMQVRNEGCLDLETSNGAIPCTFYGGSIINLETSDVGMLKNNLYNDRT
jgi:hypothetical protein